MALLKHRNMVSPDEGSFFIEALFFSRYHAGIVLWLKLFLWRNLMKKFLLLLVFAIFSGRARLNVIICLGNMIIQRFEIERPRSALGSSLEKLGIVFFVPQKEEQEEIEIPFNPPPPFYQLPHHQWALHDDGPSTY